MRGAKRKCDHPGRVIHRAGYKHPFSVCKICRNVRRRRRAAEIRAGINVITPVTAASFISLASRPWRAP